MVQWKPSSSPAASTATSSPAGSNQGSAIRAARSASSMAPCSGWVANAAAFTASSAGPVGRLEATDAHAGGRGGLGQRQRGRSAQHPQLAGPGEPVPAGQPGRRGVVAVGPRRRRVRRPAGLHERRTQAGSRGRAAPPRASRAPSWTSAKPAPSASHSDVPPARPWCLRSSSVASSTGSASPAATQAARTAARAAAGPALPQAYAAGSTRAVRRPAPRRPGWRRRRRARGRWAPRTGSRRCGRCR